MHNGIHIPCTIVVYRVLDSLYYLPCVLLAFEGVSGGFRVLGVAHDAAAARGPQREGRRGVPLRLQGRDEEGHRRRGVHRERRVQVRSIS